MTIPGARHINPDEETARLIRQRLDPPGREWGVRHPGGKITVHITGHAFDSRIAAQAERAACDHDCEWCDGGTHTLVYRDGQPWRDAP
jgi:hypothetical protein